MADPKPARLGVWAALVRPGSGLDAEVLAAWAKAVGPAAVPRAHAWTLFDGQLTVRVHSSAWAQDLSLRRSDLIDRMRADVGDGRVRELRFVVAPLEP